MAKGAPFHHTWSKVDRKYNTGGLVSVEALDRENATSVSASRVSRKVRELHLQFIYHAPFPCYRIATLS